MISRMKLNASWLALAALLFGGCIDLHDINLYSVRISLEEMDSLKTSPEIQAIHYSPRTLEFYYPRSHLCPPRYDLSGRATARCPYHRHVFNFEDPALLVQNHFLEGVKTKLDLHNIHSNSETLPPSEDQTRALQQSFGSGLILMFETRKWHLEKHDPRDTELAYSTSYDLVDSNPKYHLYYVVRGTLIRLEDSKILWRDVCNTELSFEMENGPVPSRLQITENSQPLIKARDLFATRCGKELLRKFLGR
jgi:hypothetical protein